MTEEHLFDLALNTSTAERAALLDRECADNPEMRARIEALLAADAKSNLTIDSPINCTGSFAERNETAGVVIAGKYKLVEPIGEGGMGSVWLAEQSEPVRRRVALKLIKAGMDSKQVIARFEAERQALAVMDHPNIAKVLDGGLYGEPGALATGGGRPYFVMELVKGVPITEYCDAKKLTPRERLELFVPVCQAIQHAHQKGIIHRDIKPSNVMVALYDDKPVPKVIDFGVAKATGQSLTDQSLNTGFGGIVGTPEYMSPEQASLNNLDIDTRSDIYSLGVLLYELLAGSPPFKHKDLEKAGLIEMLRVIREVDPPRPSTKLSTADALPSLSASRGTEPKKLTGILRNELDWIVMKALEKDRARRYETANGFAADINRYLNCEAVLAHPPGAVYRFKKFLRKNRGPVLAASLVLFALLAGVTGTTWGLFEAKKSATAERLAKLDAQEKEKLAVAAADNEREARLEEQRQRKFAEAISRFVQDDFLELTSVEGQDRLDGLGKEALSKDTTLRELLDRSAEKLRQRKDLDPRIEAELCWIVGVSYRRGGDAVKAIRFLERVVQRRSDLLGRDHFDTLNAMNSLAVTYSAEGKTDLALPLFEETLTLTKTKLGADHPSTLSSMNNLAMGYLSAGKLDLALPLLEETLKLRKVKLGADHPSTLTSMNNLAEGYRVAGKLDLALPLFEETLKLMKIKLGADHADTLASMNNLAKGYQAAGKLDLALPLNEETLKLMKVKLEADHPSTLQSMGNLAACYWTAGKLDLALPLFEETLKLMKVKLGANHPETLRSMNNLAEGYRAAGKFDRALPLFEETLKLTKTKQGADHPDTLSCMASLAMGYKAAGKLDLALPLFEETLKLRKIKLGTDHPSTLQSMHNLAGGYRAAGKLDLATSLFEETLTRMKTKDGTDHLDTIACMGNLADGYRVAGKLDLALPLLEETLKVAKIKLGADHPSTLTSMNNLALGYHAARKLDLALTLFEESLKLTKIKLGADHPGTLASMSNLAMGYWSTKQLDKSIPLFEQALELREAKLGREHPDTLATLANLGVNYRDAGRISDALPLLEEGYRASKRLVSLRWVGTQLLDVYVKAGKTAEAGKLVDEMVADARKQLPKDSPQLTDMLARMGRLLLDAKGFTEAEPLLRECLAIREKTQPDVWTTFNTQSLLGGALLSQKKYADAEPLLQAGYEGMKQREKTIPPLGKVRLSEAIEHLVQLYEAMDKKDEAGKWRNERAKYDQPNKEPEKK